MVDGRKLPHLSGGQGINRQLFIKEWIERLHDRLRDVRIACGDWTRVIGPSVLGAGGGVAGVFLDPPYSLDGRVSVYAQESDVAKDCLAWCLQHGAHPNLRIVLAGYDGEHNSLEVHGWRPVAWKATGGYGSQGKGRGRSNANRERLWLSPHCMEEVKDLFSANPKALDDTN